MKIVILDAYTVDQGELSWRELDRLVEVEAYERTAPEDIVNRCKPTPQRAWRKWCSAICLI